MDSKHSSIESRWALVSEHPFESLYTVCNKESMREAWCSVPAKRGAHRVSRGKTAVQRYRFRAKAISVALKAAYELNGTEIRFVSSMLLKIKRLLVWFSIVLKRDISKTQKWGLDIYCKLDAWLLFLPLKSHR